MIQVEAETIGEAWLETARRILAKAYGNLVELARLQHEVAGHVGVPVGTLVIHAKSAHVYAPELDLMADVTA